MELFPRPAEKNGTFTKREDILNNWAACWSGKNLDSSSVKREILKGATLPLRAEGATGSGRC